MWQRLGEMAARRLGPEQPPAPTVPEQLPEEVLEFLRHLGVAMCRAGDSADRVTLILEDVAAAYDAHGVNFLVLPTGVFVRIEAGDRSRVDFAPGSSAASASTAWSPHHLAFPPGYGCWAPAC